MSWMKSDRIPSNIPFLFRNNGPGGMKNSLERRSSNPGDWALLFDSRFKNFRGKLSTRWLGPYEVETIFDNGSMRIKTIDEDQISFVVNGHRLRLYHKPMSKEKFVQDMLQQSEMEVVNRGSPSPSLTST
jgi:hypothetical protein